MSIKDEIYAAHNADSQRLGPALGVACIESGVPLSTVQYIVGTTAVTAYRWVKGRSTPQHKSDVRKLKRLLYAIKLAVKAGVLPAVQFAPELLLPFWAETKNKEL